MVGSACRHVESIEGSERPALVPCRCGARCEPQRRPTVDRGGEHRPDFGDGERRAEAVMGALREREVGRGRALRVEVVRVGEHRRVAVGRGEHDEKHLTGCDLDAREFDGLDGAELVDLAGR